MLGGSSSAKDASARKGWSNVASESKDVMEVYSGMVQEAMLYLHYARFVDKCRTSEQVPISDETEMPSALETKSMIHVWKAMIEEAGLGSFGFSARSHIIYAIRHCKFNVLPRWSAVSSSDCHLKCFIEKCPPSTRENLAADGILIRNKILNIALHNLSQFVRSHLESELQNGLICMPFKQALA